MCFLWCHVRHLNPQKANPQRVKKEDKEFANKLDYSGIDFPVSSKSYSKIEKQNDIPINVFGYENNEPFPIYISKEKFKNQMNLLLITKGEKKHYVIIKDFNRFMYNQTSHKRKKHFCMYCLQNFSTETILAKHFENCISISGVQCVNMPKKGKNILKFQNYSKQIEVPFVVYADFKSITNKVEGCKLSKDMEREKNDRSYTEAYQIHEDCGFTYKIVCRYDDEFSKRIKIYHGKNAVNQFLESMLEEVTYCKEIVNKHFNKPLIIMKDDVTHFEHADKCHICNMKFGDKDVCFRDYCTITGRFRGASNNAVRITSKSLKVPVIFHNLHGYDAHLIMQQIGEIPNKHAYTNEKGKEISLNLSVIPSNMERYMSFTLGNHLTFIDSFQFMSTSLDKLAGNLPKDDFNYTSQEFEGEKLNLMTKKGVFPYDWTDSFEKFNETKLPDKKHFYSILNDQHITDDEYTHAQKVWEMFNVKTFGEYHDLYQCCDTLLLCDVFEQFRSMCLQFYGLDPCNYISSPALSWDAMLKMTKAELELMTDVNMYQFIERGMRGGISYIANRHAKANNKYMKDYDKKTLKIHHSPRWQ